MGFAQEIQDILDKNPNVDFRTMDQELSMLSLFLGTTGDGRPFYAYLRIPPSKYLTYCDRVAAQEPVNLRDFGTVEETGWGALPPQEVQRRMTERFGFDHKFAEKLEAEEERKG